MKKTFLILAVFCNCFPTTQVHPISQKSKAIWETIAGATLLTLGSLGYKYFSEQEEISAWARNFLEDRLHTPGAMLGDYNLSPKRLPFICKLLPDFDEAEIKDELEKAFWTTAPGGYKNVEFYEQFDSAAENWLTHNNKKIITPSLLKSTGATFGVIGLGLLAKSLYDYLNLKEKEEKSELSRLLHFLIDELSTDEQTRMEELESRYNTLSKKEKFFFHGFFPFNNPENISSGLNLILPILSKHLKELNEQNKADSNKEKIIFASIALAGAIAGIATLWNSPDKPHWLRP